MALKNNNPEHTLTVEELRKGGIKSGETRRNKKMLRDCLEILLEKKHVADNGSEMTGAEAVSIKLFREALKGNVKAFEVLRDTAGQKPIEKVQMKTDVNIADSAERLSSMFERFKEDK